MSTRQFDVGGVVLPLYRFAIAIEPLEPVPFVAVIPAAHRLAGKGLISLKDFDGERMVLLARQSVARHQIDDLPSSL